MKKLALAGMSIFLSATISAATFNTSLPLRCNLLGEKLSNLALQQTRNLCTEKLLGGEYFKAAGTMIQQNQKQAAIQMMDMGLADVKMAKELDCKGMSTIDWSIAEASSIKKEIG